MGSCVAYYFLALRVMDGAEGADTANGTSSTGRVGAGALEGLK